MATTIPPENRGLYITFGPDANCTLEVCDVTWSVYEYRPSLAANAIFIALYSIAMLIHIYFGIRWKSWWFMGCIVAGCLDEIIGYVGRILLYSNPFSFNAFMIQIVCITTAPVFFTAAIYVTLAKTIDSFAPSLSRFPPKLFYWVFIPLDIVSLILQAAGGALSTTSSGSDKAGVNISLAGLSFQVVTLFVFCVLFIDYLIRYRRSIRRGADGPGSGSSSDAEVAKGGRREPGAAEVARSSRTRPFLCFLSLAIVLTFARCAYRVDELSEGYEGHLIHDEGLFIALEGVFIAVSSFCLLIGHPGFIFTPAGNIKGLRSTGQGVEAGNNFEAK